MLQRSTIATDVSIRDLFFKLEELDDCTCIPSCTIYTKDNDLN